MTMVHAMKNLAKSQYLDSTFQPGRDGLTTHIPFQAAKRVAIPIIKGTAEMILHGREAPLTVRRTTVTMPPTIPPMPRPRAKITRGRLPLQIVQRMKLG